MASQFYVVYPSLASTAVSVQGREFMNSFLFEFFSSAKQNFVRLWWNPFLRYRLQCDLISWIFRLLAREQQETRELLRARQLLCSSGTPCLSSHGVLTNLSWQDKMACFMHFVWKCMKHFKDKQMLVFCTSFNFERHKHKMNCPLIWIKLELRFIYLNILTFFPPQDLGKDPLVTGKQAVEIKHTLKEPRSLADQVRTTGHTRELHLRDVCWKQANGKVLEIPQADMLLIWRLRPLPLLNQGQTMYRRCGQIYYFYFYSRKEEWGT